MNERIVDRAVALWKELVTNPKFDNGSDDPASTLASMLASKLAEHMAIDGSAINKFGVELRKLLLDESIPHYVRQRLSVDYGPSELLQKAAERSGLDERVFPWKTDTWISDDYVAVGEGYGAERVYHYPLSCDRWLITSLCGSDIKMIQDSINTNTPIEWHIEG